MVRQLLNAHGVGNQEMLNIWNVLGVTPMENEHLNVEAVLFMGCTIGKKLCHVSSLSEE